MHVDRLPQTASSLRFKHVGDHDVTCLRVLPLARSPSVSASSVVASAASLLVAFPFFLSFFLFPVPKILKSPFLPIDPSSLDFFVGGGGLFFLRLAFRRTVSAGAPDASVWPSSNSVSSVGNSEASRSVASVCDSGRPNQSLGVLRN